MIGTKLVGTLVLLTVGGSFAHLSAKSERRRLSVLDAWIELLLTVRNEIDCYLRPIDEILHGCDPRLRRACTAGEDGESLAALLRSASAYTDDETRRLLEKFSREVGSTYREEELRRCEFYIHALQARRDALATALPLRIKLAVTLSLSAALGTVILLW